MDNEDYRMFLSTRSEPHFGLNPIAGPAELANESVFPAGLLDSGFGWTEFLTGEAASASRSSV